MSYWQMSLCVGLLVLAVHLIGIALMHLGVVSMALGAYKVFLWVSGLGSFALLGVTLWGLYNRNRRA